MVENVTETQVRVKDKEVMGMRVKKGDVRNESGSRKSPRREGASGKEGAGERWGEKEKEDEHDTHQAFTSVHP